MNLTASLIEIQHHAEKHIFLYQKTLHNTIYGISSNPVNFNENPSMRAVAKILRARANEHSFHFCEQIKQRPNSGGPFDTPLIHAFIGFDLRNCVIG